MYPYAFASHPDSSLTLHHILFVELKHRIHQARYSELVLDLYVVNWC